MKTLLIVDHYLIRTAICDTLRAGSREAQILEAADTTQAARQIETERGLQLVVLDLSLPNGDGLTQLEWLRRSHPVFPVLIVSAESGQEAILRALKLGAVSFVPNSASQMVMEHALRLVLAGGVHVPPDEIGRVAVVGPTSDEATAPRRPNLSLTSR